MRQYSVWNYRERKYDYYQAPGENEGTHAGTPPTALISNALGQTPDQAAWRLPIGAKKVGSGATAKGKVASLGDDDTGDTIGTGIKIVAGISLALYLFKGIK